MKVWIYVSMTPNKKLDYVHVFTGKQLSGPLIMIEIDRSILEFGGHGWEHRFQKSGETILLPRRSQQRDLEFVAQGIIQDMFRGRFDLNRTSFRAG